MNQPYLVEAAEQAVPVGYKQTEVGMIPEDWFAYSLGQLSNFVTSGSRGWAKFYSNQGALFVRSQNVRNGKLDLEDSQFVTPKLGAEGDRTRLKLYDLLITITGNSVGNVALVKQDLGDAYISQHVGLVRLKNIEIANYVCMFLSPHSIGNFQILASQSGQSKPGLTLKDLNEFLIVIPTSQEEQVAIANALSDVDALLSELEKLIAKKQAIKIATMQQLLTGRTRLPQFSLREDGSPKGYKQSELGEVPEDWEFRTYGEVFLFLSTSTNSRADLYATGDYGYVHYGDIHTKWHNRLDLNTSELPRISSDLVSSSFLEDGDVIMADASEDYEGIGKSVEVSNVGKDKVVAGLHTFLLRDKEKQLSDGYRGYVHSIPEVKKSLDKMATGMKVYGVSKNNLKNILLPVPSKKEQTAITTVLSDMDEEIQTLDQRLNKIRHIKQGMMQELLTGKTRLVKPQVRE